MKELESKYNPHDFELRIYDMWQENNLFSPEINPNGKPYTIMMPPPNVTGNLHMGHAMYVLQDIYIRYKRMQGYQVLWQPGTDHASIATESRVVKKIKSEGKSKEELGRDGFLEEAWAWTHEYGGNILRQMKAMGFSADWSRTKFTLDEGMSKAVLTAFLKYYNDGYIYRGDRIINWCPDCKTALSEAEVDHIENDGKIWEIKYPFEDGEGGVVIATTRPETMLGDLAVAVNPADDRYKSVVGKNVVLPLINRTIPVIADDYVDMEFGTGVVKITPSHDPNDFNVGARHELGQMVVINEDATIADGFGKYSGMDRYEARKAILADLEDCGLLVSTKNHLNNVGHCSRCGTIIEPLLSKQWFVKMKELAKVTLDAFNNGEPKFYPERFGKIYRNWLEDLNDWCISRQLWWGHRIPAYYCEECGHTMISVEDVEKCEKCGSNHIKHDEDTLDTWFSSALWPFATLGWPDETEDLKKFFPSDVMITGFDIIFFWVIRMSFSARYFTGKIPFKDVLITGLVRDGEGRKMTKSLNNGIDPLDVIEKYGADALRFNMITGNSPGNDMRFNEKKVENARNFANKVWNASRFLLMNIGVHNSTDFDKTKLRPEDAWILKNLNDTIEVVEKNLSKYEVGLAADKIYSFIWEDLCDYYIEFSKVVLYGDDEDKKEHTRSILLFVLENALKLLHPFMPFITEEIYQSLPNNDGFLMIQDWPKVFELDSSADESYHFIERVKELIRSIRNAKSTRNIEPSKKSALIIKGEEHFVEQVLLNQAIINPMIQVTEISTTADDLNATDYLKVSIPEADMYLPLRDLIDYEKEKIATQKQIDEYKNEINRLNKKLSNDGFVKNAPEQVVYKEREKLANYESLLDSAEISLEEINKAL
ncbi:MAG: valine--tRNA ligase [Firmicutes bacterium]|nr:valine--tRNA ligase [Bacillota bacterium]